MGKPQFAADPDAERRREAFRRVLKKFDMTPTDLVRAAGLKATNANAIFNFLNGRAASLRQATYEKLLRALPGVTIEELTSTHVNVSIEALKLQRVILIAQV
jgi:hypothetical protein